MVNTTQTQNITQNEIMKKIKDLTLEDDHNLVFASVVKSYVFVEKDENIDTVDVIIITVSRFDISKIEYITYIGRIKECKIMLFKDIMELLDKYYVDIYGDNGFLLTYEKDVILGIPIDEHNKYFVLFMEDISTD